MYKVYVKTDGQNYITAVNSDAFLSDTTDWTQIDSGDGDRFMHAQGNYFARPVSDRGAYVYELISGTPTERAQADIDADIAAIWERAEQEAQPTREALIAALTELGVSVE